MARRPKEKLAVSLFPFLSILACVIGTLTLMITALALGQMDNDTMANAEKYQKVQDELEKVNEAIERLKREIARIEGQADNLLKQLADARMKLDQLKEEKKEPLEEEDVEIPDFDPAKAEKRLETLQDELEQLEEVKKELLAELKKRKQPPEEAEVIIQPSGSGVDLKPTFVECTSSGIVIYEGAEPQRVRRADLASDETFLDLLKRVAAAPKATVIFLVREDALGTYYAARNVAYQNGARNGKLPVIGQGKIDLSLFEK